MGEKGEQGKDAELPLITASSPLKYDAETKTLIMDKRWLDRLDKSIQQGGAVIGGGGSNTYVLLNGKHIDRSANKINFSGDDFNVQRGAKGTVDVTVSTNASGFTTETQIGSGGTPTVNSFDIGTDTFRVKVDNPLTISSAYIGDTYQISIATRKVSNTPSQWNTANSTVLATEGNIASLYTEVYTKEKDVDMNGYSIKNSNIDGGQF